MKRQYLNPVIAVLGALLLLLPAFPGQALATAPLASEVFPSDVQVLWHGQSVIVLVTVDEGDGLRVIARDAGSLAFALGYLQASADPAGLTLLRSQIPDPPDQGALSAALAHWPAEALQVLDCLAAGLNRGISDNPPPGLQGETGDWDASAVVRLAVSQSLWQEGDGVGANPVLSRIDPAGPVDRWPASGELTRWVQHLFSPRPGQQPARQHGEYAWVELNETPSGDLRYRLPGGDWEPASWEAPARRWVTSSGPLVWADEGRTLGLIYRTEAWRSELDRLETTVASWFAEP